MTPIKRALYLGALCFASAFASITLAQASPAIDTEHSAMAPVQDHHFDLVTIDRMEIAGNISASEQQHTFHQVVKPHVLQAGFGSFFSNEQTCCGGGGGWESSFAERPLLFLGSFFALLALIAFGWRSYRRRLRRSLNANSAH